MSIRPTVHPVTGRIYAVGTIKSITYPYSQGKFYGIDYIAGSGSDIGALQLVFEREIGPGSGASPVISPNGLRIYASDGQGYLRAFDINGNEKWTLFVGSHPSSPGMDAWGNIYGVSGTKLYAVKDLGATGIKLWETDFDQKLKARLSLPSYLADAKHVRCNSVVSVSKNHLYLTTASGYEILFEGQTKPVFFPLESLLIILTPPQAVTNPDIDPDTIIDKIIELPDTTESVIALDKDGMVFCAHGSVASSIAYTISSGYPLLSALKPTGGITVLGPIAPKGDFNNDGCIDRADFTILIHAIRSSAPYNPIYDLNEDGKVTIADARMLVNLFTNPRGKPCK